ncbi:tRNA-dependent cyclodipeptide synthase [Streptomyces aureus]|uniref:tRNA-dependent cyclodipeptide synthase n=1 Tax=Streptomyces aureus TaxID=193461 RepID=UPI00099F17F7|nr:tRNA-dependent cyclodipeptide synthase [Streptomyces aureus]
MTQAAFAPAETLRLQPYTDHCRVIADEGAHVVIGVSPGNSYFTAQRLRELTRWGLDHFEQVDLVYTDLHVSDMYEALGYGADEARRKAVKNLRGVRAKVGTAVAEADPTGVRVRARGMSEFRALPAYQELHRQVVAAVDGDPVVRQTCDALTGIFLAGKLAPGQEASGLQKEVCRAYICAEVPLFLDTPAILGVPSSLNCYHQALPLADLLYARGTGLRASRNQGHGILTPVEGDSR